jgi:L-threonylcarbamoyladenylate synthase
MNKPRTTWEEAAVKLQHGEVGVIPTDTLYGLVGSALSPRAVERIYALRKRDLDKPLITLVSDRAEMAKFGAKVDDRTMRMLDRVWPGPVSVIVPVETDASKYIHRGTRSIAFRMPKKPALLELLKSVGPLVAPSANLAGEWPAKSIDEACAYFGDSVFYLDEGEIQGAASALVDIRTNPPRVLRTAPGFNVASMLN